MDENQLRGIIEQAFEARDSISSKTTGEVHEASPRCPTSTTSA